jgi:hypothetical protein
VTVLYGDEDRHFEEVFDGNEHLGLEVEDITSGEIEHLKVKKTRWRYNLEHQLWKDARERAKAELNTFKQNMLKDVFWRPVRRCCRYEVSRDS